MATMDGNDPNVRAGGGDWWSQNAPPPSTNIPSGSYNKVATAPDGVPVYRNGSQYFTHNADGSFTEQFQGGLPDWLKQQTGQMPQIPDLGPGTPTATYGPSPATLPGAPSNFGAAPPTYTAPTYTPPTWEGGAPPSAPTLTRYTLPTQAELEASPGYQARLSAGLQAKNRSAAAQGSVLNGGTQQALARYGQDYASNEYSNLVGQGQSTVALNNNATQTEFGDTFANYQARYGQFNDAAAMGKNAFDTNTGNQFNAFNTNVANKRNTDLDYWSRLNDLYQTGAGLAGNSYKPGIGTS